MLFSLVVSCVTLHSAESTIPRSHTWITVNCVTLIIGTLTFTFIKNGDYSWRVSFNELYICGVALWQPQNKRSIYLSVCLSAINALTNFYGRKLVQKSNFCIESLFFFCYSIVLLAARRGVFVSRCWQNRIVRCTVYVILIDRYEIWEDGTVWSITSASWWL